MSVEVQSRAIPQPDRAERRVIGATCDRCGADALCRNAGARTNSPGPAGPWGEVDALIQGDDIYHADICRRCAVELREWIDDGAGRGMVTVTQVVREVSG